MASETGNVEDRRWGRSPPLPARRPPPSPPDSAAPPPAPSLAPRCSPPRNFGPSIATHSPRTSPTSRASRTSSAPRLFHRLPVRPPEHGDGLVVRPQPPQQPHH